MNAIDTLKKTLEEKKSHISYLMERKKELHVELTSLEDRIIQLIDEGNDIDDSIIRLGRING